MVSSNWLQRMPTRVPTTGRVSSQFVSPPRNGERSRSRGGRPTNPPWITPSAISDATDTTTKEVMQQLRDNYEPAGTDVRTPATPPSVRSKHPPSQKHDLSHEAALLRLEAAENELSEILATRNIRLPSSLGTPRSASKRLAAAKSALEELRSANLAVADSVDASAPPSRNPSLGKLFQQKASQRVASRQQQFASPTRTNPTGDQVIFSKRVEQQTPVREVLDFTPLERSPPDIAAAKEADDLRRREYRQQQRRVTPPQETIIVNKNNNTLLVTDVKPSEYSVCYLGDTLIMRRDDNSMRQLNLSDITSSSRLTSMRVTLTHSGELLGLGLELINNNIFVVSATTDAAHRHGIQSGWVLSEINSTPVNSVAALTGLLQDVVASQQGVFGFYPVGDFQKNRSPTQNLNPSAAHVQELEKELASRKEEIANMQKEEEDRTREWQQALESAEKKAAEREEDFAKSLEQVQNLENTLASRDKEIAILRKQLGESTAISQEEFTFALEQVKSLEATVASRDKELRLLRKQLGDNATTSQEEFTFALDQVKLLEKEIASRNSELEDLKENQKQAVENDKTPELVEIIDQLRLELNAADDKGTFLEAELNTARKQAEKYRSELAESAEELQLRIVEAEASGYQKGEQKSEKLSKIAAAEADKLRQQIVKLQAVEEENTDLREKLSSTATTLISKNEAATSSAAAAERSIRELQSQLATANQELEVAAVNASRSEARIENLNRKLVEAEEIVSTSDEIEQLRNKEFEDLASSVEKMRSELEKKTIEYEEIQKQLHSSSTAQTEQDARTSKLIADLQKQLKDEVEQTHNLEQQSKELSATCDQLRVQNAHYENVAKDVTDRYDAVKEQESELNQLRGDCEWLRREMTFQEEKIAEKDKLIGEMEANFNSAKTTSEQLQKQSSRLSLELQQERDKQRHQHQEGTDQTLLSPLREGTRNGKKRPASGVQFLDNFVHPPDDSHMPQVWSPVRLSVVAAFQNAKLSFGSSSSDQRPTSFSGGDLFVDKRFSGYPLDGWIPSPPDCPITLQGGARVMSAESTYEADESGPNNAPSPEGLTNREFVGQEAILRIPDASVLSSPDSQALERSDIPVVATLHEVTEECSLQLSDIGHTFSSLDAIRYEFLSTKEILHQQQAVDPEAEAAIFELENIYSSLRDSLLHYRMDFESKQHQASDMLEAVSRQGGSQFL